jgi:hypothetical protein
MALLAQLRNEGLTLRAVGEQLLVEPRSALSDSLRSTIRANKTAIVRELKDEVAYALEARQEKLESQLRAHPELRRAFDVEGAPIRAGPGPPVSAVLAVRHGDHILSGELLIPRERWDMTLFLRIVDSGQGQPS